MITRTKNVKSYQSHNNTNMPIFSMISCINYTWSTESDFVFGIIMNCPYLYISMTVLELCASRNLVSRKMHAHYKSFISTPHTVNIIAKAKSANPMVNHLVVRYK